jgi:high-affinity Fe2+/Pb2+ permease
MKFFAGLLVVLFLASFLPGLGFLAALALAILIVAGIIVSCFVAYVVWRALYNSHEEWRPLLVAAPVLAVLASNLYWVMPLLGANDPNNLAAQKMGMMLGAVTQMFPYLAAVWAAYAAYLGLRGSKGKNIAGSAHGDDGANV